MPPSHGLTPHFARKFIATSLLLAFTGCMSPTVIVPEPGSPYYDGPAPIAVDAPAEVAPPSRPLLLSCDTLSPLALSSGHSCTLTPAFPADPAGRAVSYLDGGSTCPGASVNASTGNATFSAPAKNTSCVIKVKASNGVHFSPAISSETISAGNNPPAFPTAITCPASAAALSTGVTCTLTPASPLDLDGDSIVYMDGGSTCASVNLNGTTGAITFTAPAKGATCVVKVRAYDGTFFSSAVSSNIITGTNNPPHTPSSLSCPVSPANGSTNNSCTLTARSPADPDGDSVTYSDDGSTCAAVSVNAATGNATFTAPARGATCVVKVKAHDGAAYSSAISSATITGQNRAPNTPAALACASTPLGGATGQTCTLTPTTPADPDGDTVTYSNDGSTCTPVVVNATTGAATFTAPAKSATCVVKVRAYDGITYSSAVSSAPITGQNNAPSTPGALTCTTSPLGGATGQTCTLTATSPADPDGDSVTYSNNGSTCAAVAVNAATGAVTFTAPAKAASCVVIVRASDGTAYSGDISSNTVTGQNNAPTQPASLSCPSSPLAGSTGNTCTVTAATPADLDSDSVTYANDGSTCAATTVNSSTGAVTFTAPGASGSCVIRIKSFDGTAYSSTVTSAIGGSNNPPSTPTALTCPVSPLAGSTGNACTLTPVSPADPDGDPVTYSDDGSTCPAVVVSALTGAATFTAPAKSATCVVKVRASDGVAYSSAISSATITGQNNVPNTPSALACTATPLGGATGQTCTLTATSPADPDGDSVTYSNNGSTCSAVTVNATTGAVSFTAPAKSASCVVKVRASDGTAYSGDISSNTITGQNNAPTQPASLSCPASPLAGSTGNTCTVTAATPADLDGDSVTYADDGSTCAATTVNSATGAVTFTAPAAGGSCVIKVKSFDGAAYSSSVMANIGGSNNPPSTPTALTCPASPLAGSTGNACTLTPMTPADPDGDTVTYSNDGSTCSAVVVNATTGAVTFTAPAKSATCVVKVRASDGAAFSSAISSATITGQNNTPATPSALTCTTSPLGGATGQTCTLTPTSPADPDGDSVTYSNNGSTCAAVTVNATTGAVSFTAPAKGASCVVKVRASDGTAYSGDISSATITGQNNAPTQPASLSCPSSPLAGSTGNSCTVTAATPADIDGDSVTYANDASTCAATTVNSATGAVTFTAPAAGGSCSIKVKSYDGTAYSSAVSASINGSNNPPNTPTALTCLTTPLAGSTGNSCTLTPMSPADPDGDSVTYSDNGSTCAAVNVNSTTGAATFTAPVKSATCVVKVRAYDGVAYSSAISSATITGQNNAPNTPTSLSCTTSPGGGSTGNTCTLTPVTPADPDGDTVTYSNNGSTCTAVVVNATTGSATFTAPASGATCLVKVQASDGTASSGTVSSNTITGQNNAPNIPSALSCPTTPAAASTGNTCTLTAATPADLDGQSVTYVDDASTCAATVVNATTGSTTFTAPAKGATCVVKVKAYDGAAYSAARTSATITGQNRAPNTPASLSCPTTPAAASTGNACTLTATSPADPDGDAVVYADDASTCSDVWVNTTTGNATFTAPAAGATCLVKVKAYDGTSYSSSIASATITGQNRAPNTPTALTCPTTPLAGSASNSCTLTPTSPADPDGQTVTYSNDGSTCASVSVNATTGNATFTAPAKNATCVVKVRAHDGTAYSSAISSGTITGQNNPPTIPTGLSCTTTPLGGATNQTCTLTAASPADLDGDAITYSDDASTCASVVVNSSTGNATFTAPNKGATCLVKIKASDGTAFSSTRSSATITGQNNPPNTPAGLTCPTSPSAGSTGNACTLSAASTLDKDGDAVTYSDGGSTCASPSVSSNGATITFTAPASGASCVMKVKANDGTTDSGIISSATITAPAGPVTVNLTISADTSNYDIFTAAGSPTGPAYVTLTIGVGVKVGDSARLSWAMRTGTFPAGSTITIINNGTIIGFGGNGGNGATSSNPTSCTAGTNGGHGLHLSWPVTLQGSGTIAGGGGGGGGSQYASGDYLTGSAGGSGGAGIPVGTGGTGIFAGQPGTISAGGNWVSAAENYNSCGGNTVLAAGGRGGDPGGLGENGASYCAGGTGGNAIINDGNPVNRVTPVSVTPISPATSSSCAVFNGGVKCMGGNNYYQLGDGTAVSKDFFVQTIAEDSGATQVAVATEHACALVNGGIQCWGSGDEGEVGHNSWLPRSTPIQIIASGATALSLGGNTSCAVVSGGVQCWGDNGNGDLGNGAVTDSKIPVQTIAAGSMATQISTSSAHSCAVVNGGLKCWGYNAQGQLGDGTTTQRLLPVQIIPANSGVTGVASGGSHTCAIVNSGVQCWGSNGSGQLGDGTTTNRTTAVQAIASGSGVTAISAGVLHTCAMISGAIRCWGGNDYGQLGDNTTVSKLVPTQVVGAASGASALNGGPNTTCAVISGHPYCWGIRNGMYGSKGMPSPFLTPIPTLNGIFGSILGLVSF